MPLLMSDHALILGNPFTCKMSVEMKLLLHTPANVVCKVNVMLVYIFLVVTE